jgi:8-oxo-dGTP diphosphatase
MELWDIIDKNRNLTGRFIERGKVLQEGDYHLVVFAFIQNLQGEFLISKRTPNKTFPNTWEITGGAAVKGDDSLSAILREVKEELGITLDSDKGTLIQSFRHDLDHPYFADIWHFQQAIDMADVRCQPEEVSEARFVTKQEMIALIEEERFIRNDYVLKCLELF